MASAIWSAIIGGVAGALVALITPWAKWAVDKRHIKLQRQYELLDSWRAGIAAMDPQNMRSATSTAWFEGLRPFLGKDLLGELDAPRTIPIAPDTERGHKDKLADAVDGIEREWGLRPGR
ncbi:hypothetical protein [Rhodococcus wratislaviensis]|uniref:hypothetical protein n=1 Tax=Rhodococcus wratislaviensis TaxID=44752 RepID=UPI000F5622EF|nr:hypothetical protein [Rhodococcus wratislaviensis]